MDADPLELLDDEDFVFEPTARDLAFAVGIRVDPDGDRAALEELGDAMLVWMDDGPGLERLTSKAMRSLWTDELETMLREGLTQLAGQDDWRAAAEAAMAELERDPRGAEVSREVVRELAVQLAHHGMPVFFCLDCLEEWISAAPPEERRALAASAAIVACHEMAVPDGDLVRMVAAPGRTDGLGTRARRLVVRRRLGRLAAFGRDSLPELASELQALADEELPAEAEEDDVWGVVCGFLLAEAAAPGRN